MYIQTEDLAQTLGIKKHMSSIFFSKELLVALFHFTCFDHTKRKWKKFEISRPHPLLVLLHRIQGKYTQGEFDPENLNLFAYNATD